MRERSKRQAFPLSVLLMAGLFVQSGLPALADVQPGDQVLVKVFNHDELSTTATVDSRGHLTLPLAGDVNVAGLETSTIASRIESALSPYVRHPAVNVQVVGENKAIYVSGGPGGTLAFSPGESLTTALSDIQKTLDHTNGDQNARPNIDALDHSRIDLHHVSVRRNNKILNTYDTVAMRRTGNPGPTLRPNDTIVLVDKPIAVRVNGAVGKPGTAYLDNDEPLNDAIAQVGGPLPTAATSHITLARPGAAPKFVALGDAVLTQPPTPGDSLLVPAAPRITVAGMVDKPGVTVLENNFSLLSALYSAGGVNRYANLKDVQVVRNGVRSQYDITQLTHGNLDQDPALQDGDLVFVPEGHKIDFLPILNALSPFAYLVR